MTEDHTDHDTSTDDEVGDLELGEPEAIPVAEAPPLSAPSGPTPPVGTRTFPQHYSLLFGAVMVLVASLSVWEREHVLGRQVSGPEMITGTFLLVMSLYVCIVGVLNIVQGRLRGMMAAFVTGASSLYFGIVAFSRTLNADACLGKNEISKFVNDHVIPQRFLDNPDLTFPSAVLSRFDDKKQIYTYWIGQFGPGVWFAMLGGALIVLVFLKAFFPSKKAAPAPAPRSPRRRR